MQQAVFINFKLNYQQCRLTNKEKEATHIIYNYRFHLAWFNGIATIIGYLMAYPVYIYIYIYDL